MNFNREILEQVSDELSLKLGRPAEEIKQRGLSVYDFTSNDKVEVLLEDGSSVNLKYAFYVECPEKGVIAVFSEHCGYYLFPYLGTTVRIAPQTWVEVDEDASYCCDRFKESVTDGNILHADDIPDETEWYLPEAGHIYYCPFCGSFIKGEGFGTFHGETQPNNATRPDKPFIA